MVRRIYWYLWGSRDVKLKFPKGSSMNFSVYCDASFANLENYRSLSGHIGLIDKTPVLWQSVRKLVVAKSTQESEYPALTPAMQVSFGPKTSWKTLVICKLQFQSTKITKHASLWPTYRRSRHI
jgi:hypothetical protein